MVVFAIESDLGVNNTAYGALDYDDFLMKEKGFRIVRHLARRPDVATGRARYFPFPRYEEEPFKIDFIRRSLAAYRISKMDVDDIVYRHMFYVTPTPSAHESEELRACLGR